MRRKLGRTVRKRNDPVIRLNLWVAGRVQGVGFRWWTRTHALELGLVGVAKNLPDGRVAVVAEGERQACERLRDAIRAGESPGSVAEVVEQWCDARGGLQGFREA
ncbi:acylphosphatase [Pseudonocardia yunnanensis]|uniref:acylphosphatase n=1 Tax=Pseudonocardia yunnanensis TaxID=58107 RepID=A0ABW4EWX9_9PSEU